MFNIFAAEKLNFINDAAYLYVHPENRKRLKNKNIKLEEPIKIVAVAVDEDSIHKLKQRVDPSSNTWNKRSIYKDLVNVLHNEGAKVIGFDFVFLGQSEDINQDIEFAQALKNASVKTEKLEPTSIVLGFTFKKSRSEIVPIFPLDSFKQAAYSIGFIDIGKDVDGKSRKIDLAQEVSGNNYFHLSLQMATAYLKGDSQAIYSAIPSASDGKNFLNFSLKLTDNIYFLKNTQDYRNPYIRIGFYDVVNNLEDLKQKFGNDFIKNSLVIVYPEASIFHDTVSTPLGELPGGFIHINSIINILNNNFYNEINFWFFILLSFVFVGLILIYLEFDFGLLCSVVFILLNYILLVQLNLKGITFDFSKILVFICIYFALGSSYKYLAFHAKLRKIKNKATTDPIRNIFTLRYFYYRLNIEMDWFEFIRKPYVFFINLSGIKDQVESGSLDAIKNIWQEILPIISLKGSFWAMYAPEELVGFFWLDKKEIETTMVYLQNNLNVLFSHKKLNIKVKITNFLTKKEYRINEILYIVSEQLKKSEKNVEVMSDKDFINLLYTSGIKAKAKDEILESLDQDIEEKNRQVLSLYESLKKEHGRTKDAFFQIINSLVNALEARDPYTQGHSQRVSTYALKLAEKLNWSLDDMEKLKRAALLHDLGKIGIPDGILHKKDKLTDEEFDFIRKHEIIGVNILKPLKDFAEILPWILYHHERYDGKGYPHGLGGNSIPLAAQIISVADVFDALTTGRDYKKAFPIDDAVKEIVKNKGTQFNPQLVDVFVEAVLETPLQQLKPLTVKEDILGLQSDVKLESPDSH